YEEHIVSVGKRLTIVGGGAEVTELVWGGTETIVQFVEPSGLVAGRITDMSIRRLGASGRGVTLEWSASLYLERCELSGTTRGHGGWHESGNLSLQATDTLMESIDLFGGGWSYLTGCTFANAEVVGWFDYVNTGPQRFILTSCEGDTVHIGAVADLDASDSELGGVRLHGGYHAWPSIRGRDSDLGHVRLTDDCDIVDVHDCDLLSFSYVTAAYDGGLFELIGSTVHGSVTMQCIELGPRIEHNTIMGGFEYTGDWWASPNKFRSNIIVGHTTIETGGPLVISHNDFVGGSHIVAAGATVTANIELDPLFCDSPDDVTLQSCSPCVGAAHDGTEIGAWGVACECSTPVQETSWGAITSGYRQPSNSYEASFRQ
ncbi:MAG: hypothetical protein ABIK85_05450, partial [Candidatus Eisenbacteria bacterium]